MFFYMNVFHQFLHFDTRFVLKVDSLISEVAVQGCTQNFVAWKSGAQEVATVENRLNEAQYSTILESIGCILLIVII